MAGGTEYEMLLALNVHRRGFRRKGFPEGGLIRNNFMGSQKSFKITIKVGEDNVLLGVGGCRDGMLCYAGHSNLLCGEFREVLLQWGGARSC